jgi:glycosyltransferase involved in cell wall biosynthesis
MNKKHIVLLTQYFPPEIGGGSQRSVGFVEELAALGADVTVVTPFPSYLLSKDQIEKKYKLYEKSALPSGITVYRTFVYSSDRGKFVKRILYYLSFMFSSVIVTLFKIKKIDCLITISPPYFTGISGAVIKKIKRLKFIFDIGDLWPEGAIQLGYLKNKFVISLAEAGERWIYKNSDVINVVTRLTKEKLLKNHKFIKKILYAPNFVNTDVIKKSPKNDSIIDRLSLRGKMVFGYAGNIGSAQGLKIVADAAEMTKGINDIAYLVIGEGVDCELLKNLKTEKKLDNLILHPPVSREKIVDYISVFDVMIIPLIKNELFKITIPSKLYESMAAEIPVLLGVDGEAKKIVEEAECGLWFEPENAVSLKEKIMEFYNNKMLAQKLGANGRKVAERDFSRKSVIGKFYNELLADE